MLNKISDSDSDSDSTCNIACLNTTNNIANPNTVGYMKMYSYVISFPLSTPMAKLNTIILYIYIYYIYYILY